jgi:hypothetical protein
VNPEPDTVMLNVAPVYPSTTRSLASGIAGRATAAISGSFISIVAVSDPVFMIGERHEKNKAERSAQNITARLGCSL